MKKEKPLGRPAYGSIGHLSTSRLGPSDHKISEGQERILTLKRRDENDNIVVQEKLDGSCVSVVRVGREIIPLIRAGYRCTDSRFEQHLMFHDWAMERKHAFLGVLNDGERICGEWLAQKHGTEYDLSGREPFAAFDIFNVHNSRLTFNEFYSRVFGDFEMPSLLHEGGPISVDESMRLLERKHWDCDEPEGVVYRCERGGVVEFLAKHVRAEKIDGKYLESVTGLGPQWNWTK